jgi:hypothetical protein
VGRCCTYEVFCSALDTTEPHSEFSRAEGYAQRFATDKLSKLGFSYAGNTRDVDALQPFRKRHVGKWLFEWLRKGDCLVIWRADMAFRSVGDAAKTLSALRDRGVSVFLADEPFEAKAADPAFWARLERAIRSRRGSEGWVVAKRQGYRPRHEYLNPRLGFQIVKENGIPREVPCEQDKKIIAMIRKCRRERIGPWRAYLRLREAGMKNHKGKFFCFSTVRRIYRDAQSKSEPSTTH